MSSQVCFFHADEANIHFHTRYVFSKNSRVSQVQRYNQLFFLHLFLEFWYDHSFIEKTCFYLLLIGESVNQTRHLSIFQQFHYIPRSNK